jgi:hypothetical protein
VRIEKILYTVLHEAHKRQVEKVINTLKEGSEGLYKPPPYCSRNTDLPPVPPVFVLKWLSTGGTGGKRRGCEVADILLSKSLRPAGQATSTHRAA